MGLDLGAISPEEIAISVAAEMIAVRRNPAGRWRSLSMSVFPRDSAAQEGGTEKALPEEAARREVSP
jgi:xanthine/CO dehydrogenase XdhC/CoxF family maturation factor